MDRQEQEEKINDIINFNVNQGIEFIKRYHPALWDRMDKEDLALTLAVASVIFKVNPEILEANQGHRVYVQ
jgi:hypothetical protein